MVQKEWIQPISETDLPDQVLFIYLEQTDKSAPKQKSIFQNHSSKNNR